jgi:N-acetylmuramoyl-L-alanine amidase
MVLEITEPLEIKSLSMAATGQGAETILSLELVETDADAFAALSGAPAGAGWDLPQVADVPVAVRRQTGDRDIVVALDPGHGGIDPGAVAGGMVESDLMLSFVRELREAMVRAGGFEVILTRETDVFVPLETRVSIARAVQADLFMSFHADAIATGTACGAAVFTVSDEASDRATGLLAERHDRADLLAGVDLGEQGDEIAHILMDLARLETQPRADALGDTVADAMKIGGVRLFKRPRQAAGFSVLKAPDIPSILVELGYLSSESDRKNLASKAWRATTIDAIVNGIQTWAIQDAAQARLLRQ